MPPQLSPEVIASLVGAAQQPDYLGVGYSPAQQGRMQQGLTQQGVFPNDSGPKADLLRRLLEVERTRRLSDAQGNAAAAENVRKGFFTGDWFQPDLKAVLGGK